MVKFDELFIKLDETEAKLEAKKSKLSAEEYATYKNILVNERANLLNQKAHQEDIYGSITSDKDKKLYEKYYDVSEGIFKPEYIYNDYLGTSFNEVNYTGTGNPYEAPMQYSGAYNSFFTKDGEVLDTKYVSMGKNLYNKILTYANNNNIDFKELGITKNSGSYTFGLNHGDTKAFIKFAECYEAAIDDSFMNGLFIDTANDLFGEGSAVDGKLLTSVGKGLKRDKKRAEKIQETYGVGTYYLPMISLTSKDITYGIQRMNGTKVTDLNEHGKYLTERIRSANLLNYKIYGNVEDIENSNGGNNPLIEITDGKIKEQIQNAIFNGTANPDTKLKQGEMTYSFATVGGTYGTMITIPKGEGTYTVFVEQLLPSDEAKAHVSHPYFIYSNQVERWNAIGKENRKYNNNLSMYTGYFTAAGNNEYSYTIPGYDKDGYDKTTYLDKEDVIALKQYTDYFNYYCVRNGSYEGDGDIISAEEIEKFMTTRDSDNPKSMVDILCQVTGNAPEVVTRDLMNMYKTYYKK